MVPHEALSTRVNALLLDQPLPPRRVATTSIVLAMYQWYRSMALRVLALMVIGLFLFVITFFQSGSASGIWFLRVVWALWTLYLLVGPVLRGLSIARWMRDGVVTTADLIEVSNRKTQYGLAEARVRRLVHHPALGNFHDELVLIAPLTKSLCPGATVDVLVAPHERKTWMTLGLHSENQPPRERVDSAS
jgi:hypothetical protein